MLVLFDTPAGHALLFKGPESRAEMVVKYMYAVPGCPVHSTAEQLLGSERRSGLCRARWVRVSFM